MTVEERKRGLRAAVESKLCSKQGSITLVIEDRHQREALLWQVIDSLVEECTSYANVLAEFMADVEGAGVEEIEETWPDLAITYQHAKAVRPADTKENA